MFEEMIIAHCSPTLAGLKTANIFTCPYSSKSDVLDCIRQWNKALSSKGLRILPLRYSERNVMIYIYRPAMLKADLKNEAACASLRKCGYSAKTCGQCIVQLMKRLENCEEFPHEIGLFLGYPPEDVSGFISNNASACKCVGCWKVYGDEESAKKTFAKYKKCKRAYCEQYAKGKSIEQLTVAG